MNKNNNKEDFSGDPVVKTPCPQSRGVTSSIPGQETKIPHITCWGKNDNNTIFIPLNNDNEWVSVKRDINYRLVYKDKIVKKIKYKFVKQIQKQKNSN